MSEKDKIEINECRHGEWEHKFECDNDDESFGIWKATGKLRCGLCLPAKYCPMGGRQRECSRFEEKTKVRHMGDDSDECLKERIALADENIRELEFEIARLRLEAEKRARNI